MGFTGFKEVGDVLREHQLAYREEPFSIDVFREAPAALVDELKFTFDEIAYAASEFAICENLIYPVLRAAYKPYTDSLALWSHKALYEGDTLLGIPDYTIAKRSPLGKIVFDAPYVAVIEAKRDDFTGGWGQCALEMIALRRVNQRPDLPVYGIVSNGRSWEFGRFDGVTLTIYRPQFQLDNVDELLSGLATIFEQCKAHLQAVEA